MGAWSNAASGPESLWVEHLPGDGGTRLLSLVRHPGHAWVEPINWSSGVSRQVEAAAVAYLEALVAKVPDLAGVLQALGQGAGFGWLPLRHWKPGAKVNQTGPDVSFVLRRQQAGNWCDATVVLLAARRINGKPVGDGVGLRVLAHMVDGDKDRPPGLYFSSVTCSRVDQVGKALRGALTGLCESVNRAEVRSRVQQALDAGHVAIHAFRDTPDDDTVELQGRAIRWTKPAGRQLITKVLGFEVAYDTRSRTVAVQRIEDLSARVDELRLFDRDPASMGPPETMAQRHPGQDRSRLDAWREWQVKVPPALQRRAMVPMKSRDKRWVVTHDRRSVGGRHGAAVMRDKARTAALPNLAVPNADPLQVLPLRSDDLAAAQAYLRGKALFDRFDAYGFDAQAYFRHAQLPLLLRPRARLPGADDGRVLNAEVRPYYRGSVPEADLLAAKEKSPYAENLRPHLQVRFGTADADEVQGPQGLGLAADPRWAWHEFGHVLNFASTGELEFGFAHSAGDALAAIVADPDSTLAVDERLRGLTFPWAFVPRRHDRSALQGYCWCGQRSQLRLQHKPTLSHHRHGYFEEELLSSSLFRLYLCLGGATGTTTTAYPQSDPAPAERECRRSASDYCVYLIMRAIALLGPNGVVPTLSAGQFVGALIDADLGTGLWQIEPQWPVSGEPRQPVLRRGGQVHKVIRWAFEQQGLYAATEPDHVAEGAGQPPPGDVFVADRRGGNAGGYKPVPLVWDDQGRGPWYANEQAISRGPQKTLTVRLQHRGSGSVGTVVVTLWVCTALSGKAQWKALNAVEDKAGSLTFTADARDYQDVALWVLANASSATDPSNLPADRPPPVDQRELIELVAHDNNLALARLS